MYRWLRIAFRALFFTGILVIPCAAIADVDMSVMPKLIVLSNSNRVATVTLQNRSPDPTLFQVFTLAWTQDGSNKLEKTDDLIAMPRVFYIAGLGAQTIRVAMQGNADPKRERAYRLIVRAVPTKLNPLHVGIRIALGMALPLYIEPDAALVSPKLRWSMKPAGQSHVRITVENVGEKHALITRLRLTDEKGRALRGPDMPIVLAGQSISAVFTLPSSDSHHVNVSARVDGTPQQDEVAVGSP